MVKKIKNAVSLTYFISDLKSQQIVGTFYKKELQKTNEKEFRADKVIKRKSDKLYVKWKGYNSFVNSCIDKKRHGINGWIFSRTEIFSSNSESLIRFT